MPDQNDFTIKKEQSPQLIKDTLFANSTTEAIFAINTSYGLKPEQQRIVAKTIGSLLVKDLALENFLGTLQKEANLTEDVAAGICLGLGQKIFLPLKKYFPDIETLISQWQAKAVPPKYPAQSLGLSEEPKTEKEPEIELVKPMPRPTPPQPRLNGNIVDLRKD